MRKKFLTAITLVMALVFTGCEATDETLPTSIETKIITQQVSEATQSQPTSTESMMQPSLTECSDELTDRKDVENDIKEITISFLGDCTLGSMKGKDEPGNMVNYLNTKDTSYFFEKCMPYISTDDFTVANCETVLSDYALTEISKEEPAFWFRSSTKNAFVFSDNSIDAVSISNNHTNDYGSAGLAETKKALEDANVLWADNLEVIYLEKYDIKFGIICAKFYNSYYTNGIVEKIKEISESTDIQIVFFHGGTEKIHEPESWKIEGSHAFIDAGADLVVGGHPHVLQPFEVYNDKHIIYSIGNFCYGGHRHPENKTVIYQETFTFDNDNNFISSYETMIPCYVYTGDTNNWQPTPMENPDEQNEVLDFLYNGLK